MKKLYITILMLGVFVLPNSGKAESYCTASLHRLNKNFCISTQFSKNTDGSIGEQLRYNWKVALDEYDLVLDTCLSDYDNQDYNKEIVLIIDRAQTLAIPDSLNGQSSSRSLEIITSLLNNVKGTGTSTKVSMVMFSSSSKCSEYNGGNINASGYFPCLFVPSGSIHDSTHFQKLKSFISNAENKYSPSGLDQGSDYLAWSELLRKNTLNLDTNKEKVVILFSDGRTFINSNNDNYAYLQKQNYINGHERVINNFKKGFNDRYRFIYALLGTNYNAYSNIFTESFDNMCKLNPDIMDCNQTTNIQNPDTWPVNKLNLAEYAVSLLTSMGSTINELINVDSMDNTNIMQKLRLKSFESIMNIDQISLTTSHNLSLYGDKNNNSFVFKNIPVLEKNDLTLNIRSGSQTLTIPLYVALEKVDTGLVNDKEMKCELEGKSKKSWCGVIGSEDYNKKPLFPILLLMFPIIFILFFKYKTIKSN